MIGFLSRFVLEVVDVGAVSSREIRAFYIHLSLRNPGMTAKPATRVGLKHRNLSHSSSATNDNIEESQFV